MSRQVQLSDNCLQVQLACVARTCAEMGINRVNWHEVGVSCTSAALGTDSSVPAAVKCWAECCCNLQFLLTICNLSKKSNEGLRPLSISACIVKAVVVKFIAYFSGQD